VTVSQRFSAHKRAVVAGESLDLLLAPGAMPPHEDAARTAGRFFTTRRRVHVKELGFEGRCGDREHENLATLGSYCAVPDLDWVALSNQSRNQQGRGPIAVAVTIGWQMAAFARNEIALAETCGMSILFATC